MATKANKILILMMWRINILKQCLHNIVSSISKDLSYNKLRKMLNNTSSNFKVSSFMGKLGSDIPLKFLKANGEAGKLQLKG